MTGRQELDPPGRAALLHGLEVRIEAHGTVTNPPAPAGVEAVAEAHGTVTNPPDEGEP